MACPRGKLFPQTETKDASPQRFTPDDIVSAIKGVEKAGLDIYNVKSL